jgi:hypothetical protein
VTAGSERWHDALDAHCEGFLGPAPHAVGEIVPSSAFTVTLYPHAPRPGRPWLTVRTAGVSDHPMAVPPDREAQRYCELLTYLPHDWELEDSGGWWPAAMLRRVGQFVHEHETWLAQGHTVTLSEPGETYAPGTPFSAVLLRAPDIEDPDFDELEIEGVPCRFLWAFPITQAETDHKLEHGSAALLELVHQHDPGHILNPARACLITGRTP